MNLRINKQDGKYAVCAFCNANGLTFFFRSNYPIPNKSLAVEICPKCIAELAASLAPTHIRLRPLTATDRPAIGSLIIARLDDGEILILTWAADSNDLGVVAFCEIAVDGGKP